MRCSAGQEARGGRLLLLPMGSNSLTIYNICQLIDMLWHEACEEELLLPLCFNTVTIYNLCIIIDILRPEACEEELLTTPTLSPYTTHVYK